MKNTTDMTEGVIWKQLLLFALPIFLSNLFQQLYNVTDSIIVGQFVGSNALAAVSSSGTLIFMFVGFFNGTAMGAGIIIAKYFGEKDYDNMRRAIHTDVALGLIAGLAVTVLGVFLSPCILKLMQIDSDIYADAVVYFRIYFAGSLANILYNVAVGILHAVGDSRHPLYYLMFTTVLNVGLDFLFVGAFNMGVGGAALATIISQAVNMLLAFTQLMGSHEVYKVRIKELRIHGDMLRSIIKFGLPSGIQNSVIGLANVIVQSNINSFGKYATAGFGAYAKIEGFVFLPITCFAMGIANFVGQNIGAKKYDRVKRCARFGIVCSITLAEFLGLIMWLFAPSLIGIFISSGTEGADEIINYGVTQIRTEAFFFCFLAFSHCIAGVCRGSGRAFAAMVIMLSVWCVLRITYITIIMNFVHEIQMIYWAYPITWGTSSVIYLIYYLKADWIHGFERRKKKLPTDSDGGNGQSENGQDAAA